MSAGSGYRYLLRSVAAGDGNRALSTPLTRYYAEAGTPPGQWMGSGVRSLGGGQLAVGTQVTEEQLALLIGMGRDPLTGEQLGRAYPIYKPLGDRIKERVDGLDPEMTLEDCAAESSRIEAEETAVGMRQAVAGFDLTFSVPKSVSVLWGIADASIQERIVHAHHAAVAEVLDYFEREVAATRTGVADQSGAVAQVEVAGVAAVAYDHYDSRAADPQLHTHLVVSNKVFTLLDQRWRSLDSRPVHASVTGLSAHYNALLADRLSRDLGIAWELRERGVDRNPQWEIAGISQGLINEFSSRSREIEIERDRLIEAYREAHGRMPSEKKIVELRAQATLATRPPKQIRSLADLTDEWRDRASGLLNAGVNATVWQSLGRASTEPLRVDDISLAAIQSIGAETIANVSVKRSTWTHWNLVAEASRQLMGLRFATTLDREAALALVVDAAEHASVALTPPDLALSPAAFRRTDGTSVFRPRYSTKFSSQAVIEAEARLLDRRSADGAPVVDGPIVQRAARRGGLSYSQAVALSDIATSGLWLDVLVGPAGAGKTTTMGALRHAWIAAHGKGSVIGLAPSATAAQALADDLGISCDNTTKWFFEHDRNNPAFQLHTNQLLIVDEATLAGTVALDRITAIARSAGAKVLLVGDPHQLQSVDAGGAFALLVDRRPDAPTLAELHRFTEEWEKEASLKLRAGKPEVISTYILHGRVHDGTTDQMLDAAYEAWRADNLSGKASILVTESASAVRTLNERARADRLLLEGVVDGREVPLHDGAKASVGDFVITRRNDRALVAMGRGWVKNGDRWRIADIRNDGSVVVRRLGGRRGSAVLPPAYVREHVDLGYAITAHRAQGITVDTAHVVVSASTTRENLYVSMSRGRASNTAYVALDQPDDSHTTPEPDDVSARTVLYGVLQHSGESVSAHQTIEVEHATYAGIDRLAAELETIAANAQRERFADLIRRSGLTPEQAESVLESAAFGPLSSTLRRAEAFHHDLEKVVPRAVAQHDLTTADDIAAVLRSRITRATAKPPRYKGKLAPRLIAGLIPEPLGAMSSEDREAIDQRKHLIETRARGLAEAAAGSAEPWVRRLGGPPTESQRRQAWLVALTTVAAYRDRYRVVSNGPTGGHAASDVQRADRLCAVEAARVASSLAARSDDPTETLSSGPAIPTP